jgi:hypothetical protein
MMNKKNQRSKEKNISGTGSESWNRKGSEE